MRLSPSDEVREEGSLVSHPQRIKSHVEYKNSQEPGWGEIVEVYTDKDYSGKDTNRPAFRRMLQDIKIGRINAVIFTELSRVSRDVKDFCNFWEFLKSHKATFVSLKENFDTTTPIGEMMVIQAISFAQFERKTIVQRIKDGARARAERGLANGGVNVIGFDRHPHKRGTLLVNEEEATVVRHIFDKFLELGTVAKTREYLNQNGYRTKSYVTNDGRQRGGQIWTLATLHSLITNVRVIGKVEVNADNKNAPSDQVNRLEQYRQVEASWPAIVSPEIFAAVQDKLCHNGRFAKHHIHQYRLSGLVECGLCGKELSGQSANGIGGKYFYYAHCRKHGIQNSHQDRCRLERMPAIRLEEAVIGRLMELASSRKLLAQLAKDSQVDTEQVNQEIEKVLASKEQEKRKLDRMIDNLVASLADLPKGMAPMSILEKVADLEWQRDQILNAMSELRGEKRNKVGKVINTEHVFRVFRLFNREFATRPAHEQREILRSVVQKVVVQEKGIRVFYYGTANDDKVTAELDRDIEAKLLGTAGVISGRKTAEKSVETANSGSAFNRTGVRPVSRMVGIHRLELWTSAM